MLHMIVEQGYTEHVISACNPKLHLMQKLL